MKTFISRAGCTVALGGGLLALTAGVANAHVTVDAPGAQQGSTAVATFRIPTESETAATTAVTVTVPNLRVAMTEPMPGWTAKVDRNDKSEVTAVTWTADPGNPGVGPGQFQRFAVALGPLPQQDSVSFPTKQTYSDGKVVDWNQPADQGTAANSAPTLTLAAVSGDGPAEHGVKGENQSAAAGSDDTGSIDTTARWLGGIGLAAGLLGLGLGVGSVIRGRQS
ncbi:YcnI family protein [Nocardia cyriacigeorgica]|uniref:YcnI family protein n=1 Tax=Nocardia cyriacigeorgica TaxID=135487 RepID=A0A5R8PLK2_9NOCA|nr:YcnI family protein [Nocardia cyriacigeorgica]TLG17929.1 YcnI family protein [Nocardia cyriacigeorgica]